MERPSEPRGRFSHGVDFDDLDPETQAQIRAFAERQGIDNMSVAMNEFEKAIDSEGMVD